MTPLQYGEALFAKNIYVGDGSKEDTLNNIFIERIDESIRYSLRGYWTAHPRTNLTNFAIRAQFLLAFSGGRPRGTKRQQIPTSRDSNHGENKSQRHRFRILVSKKLLKKKCNRSRTTPKTTIGNNLSQSANALLTFRSSSVLQTFTKPFCDLIKDLGHERISFPLMLASNRTNNAV